MLRSFDYIFYRFMFSPVFEMLLSLTKPSIPMIVLKVPSGSLYCNPNRCLSCMSNVIDTSFPHPVADTVLPCPDPKTGDYGQWLYVSLETPFAVLIAYLA